TGDDYTFMDPETFEQETVAKSFIGDAVAFLQEGMDVTFSSYENEKISISLPETVVMTIIEAEPVVKGQTASSSFKPAKLDNNARIMVPPHIESGTRVIVNTADGSYVERAKD
ncbi:MAG: elongation factor P, partial [Pedobacter sp.]